MAERIVYEHWRADPVGGGRAVSTGSGPLPVTRLARRKSPDGFAWGYCGSGPAALAHSILAHACGDVEVADEHYQAFKRQHVSTWNDGWRITRAAVLRWLQFARSGIDAPQVWVDGPPDPPARLVAFVSDADFSTYCDIARLAWFRADGVLGDLLEQHGLDRTWAPLIQAKLPPSWQEENDA